MAIEAVKGRLLRAADARTRWLLAMNLAETCYECFNVENLFRELIDRDPVDLDGILTALVELDLALKHIATHWGALEKPLEEAIHRVDLAYSKARRAAKSRRKTKRTASRRRRRFQPRI
ncbi:MAG TPA: hypothetical protein VFM39_05625 [bacterium]|nr:hypothetical protein [bacterium]